MKLGVLGGTFDPVHRGHLMMAGEARRELDLGEVLMVPAGRPMSKTGHRITAARHRLAMLRLALRPAERPWLKLSTMEIERPGPSYTVDTVAALKASSGGDDIYFILGWDSLEQLPTWREPERLVGLCRLAAVPRPGQTRPDLAALERAIPGISGRIVFVERPCVDISASDIRERVGRGEPVGGLVPDGVADYIEKHRLYVKSGGKH
jgi:nicotinate-nucleotide adenylyltransferase